MARITISRVFTRNVTKFFLVFSFGALVCLLIVKSVYVDPSRRLSESQMIDKALREAAVDNDERVARVKRVCKKYRLGIYRPDNFDEIKFKEPPVPQYQVFYVDRKRNVSYCPIYKAGSTSWIFNLCLLNGVPEEELLQGNEQLSTIARRVMPAIDYPEADELLKKSIKLMTVRHPFERLLSAYRDKLENSIAGREHGSLHFFKRYGEKIVRKYRDKNRPTPSADQVILRDGYPRPAGTEPTWREFVEYLLDTDLDNYADDHWTPYYLFCTPCQLDYDFIAKVETLGRDQAYAISRLGLGSKIRPRWRHSTAEGHDDPARIYFSQLTRDHVMKLESKFKLDLELFDYSAERYYELATATL